MSTLYCEWISTAQQHYKRRSVKSFFPPCFVFPPGTIELVVISTGQNPLISPHKATSYIPRGYHRNSLDIQACFLCTALHFSTKPTVCPCKFLSLCKRSEPSEQQDQMFPPLRINQVSLSRSVRLSACLSIRPSVDHLTVQWPSFVEHIFIL